MNLYYGVMHAVARVIKVSKPVLRNEYSRCYYLYFYRNMFQPI
jgi:hypothetical protein